MTTAPTTDSTRLEAPRTRAGAPPRGPVVSIATWSARHKWAALFLWIAFVAAAIVGGGSITAKESNQAEETLGASAGADLALMDADFGEMPTESILVQNAAGGSLTAAGPLIGPGIFGSRPLSATANPPAWYGQSAFRSNTRRPSMYVSNTCV